VLAGGLVLAANIAVAAGTGTQVHVTATAPGVHVFVARGDVDANGADDPFEDVGAAPLTIELAPGTYTFETGSPATTVGHSVVRVGSMPLELQVKAGNATMKLLGSVVMALGAVAAVAGVVVLASVSPSDENFPRIPVSVPLILGGTAIFGGGYALSRSARTDIVTPRSEIPTVPRASIFFAPVIRF